MAGNGDEPGTSRDASPPAQYERPAPRDALDEDTEDTADETGVDAILRDRHRDRNTDLPAGRTGEITSMEVEHSETTADRPETDPFHEGPAGEDVIADVPHENGVQPREYGGSTEAPDADED